MHLAIFRFFDLVIRIWNPALTALKSYRLEFKNKLKKKKQRKLLSRGECVYQVSHQPHNSIIFCLYFEWHVMYDDQYSFILNVMHNCKKSGEVDRIQTHIDSHICIHSYGFMTLMNKHKHYNGSSFDGNLRSF